MLSDNNTIIMAPRVPIVPYTILYCIVLIYYNLYCNNKVHSSSLLAAHHGVVALYMLIISTILL